MQEETMIFNGILTGFMAETPMAAGITGNRETAAPRGGFAGLLEEAQGSLEPSLSRPAGSGSFASVKERLLAAAEKRIDGENPSRSISGEGMLGRLKDLLESGGTDISKMRVNAQGLEGLEGLLLGAGYDAGEVEALMEGLKEKAGAGEISLGELFSALGTLEEPTGEMSAVETFSGEPDEESGEGMLEISALPFVESILTAFGVDPAVSGEILAGATSKGDGIDIASLAEDLKGMREASFRAGRVSFQAASRSGVGDMMRAIGMDGGTGPGGPLTLESFVSELEAMVADRGTPGEMRSAGGLDGFLSGIRVEAAESAGVETNPVLQAMDPAKLIGGAATGTAGDRPLEAVLDTVLAPQGGAAGGQGGDPGGSGERDLLRMAEAAVARSGGGGDENILAAEKPYREVAAAARASAPAETPPAGRTLPGYLVDQVARKFQQSMRSGETELSFQVKPPRLGRIGMSIETAGDSIRVSIITEHQAAKEMLVSQLSDLKGVLGETGVRIESVEVSTPFNFDQSMAEKRNGGEGSSGRRRRPDRAASDGGGGDDAVRSAEPAARRGDGVLDLVA
jgi:hypothetical protein